MPNEKQPDTQDEPTPVKTELVDLARKFTALLESNFIESVPDSTSEESMDMFRRQMMRSFVATMRDTGASPAEVATLLQAGLGSLLAPTDESWSDAKNDRRVELIDQSIQGALSPDEGFELDQLTEQMRKHCDTENSIPMQGARRLHEYLQGLDKSARDPD